MGKVQRIPLEERLRHGWEYGGTIPAVFGVCLDHYFAALSQMCGSLYYSTLYDTCLSDLNQPGDYCLLPEAVAAAADRDAEEHGGLLIRILAEPFTDGSVWEGKEGKGWNGT